jgi:translation initiation factor 3 subunit F
MYDLHHRVSPQEVIVGWFSTGLNLTSSDALIQDFYSKEANFSIHLKVDTNLTGNSFQVKAYGSKPLGLGDKTLASEFIEMPTEVLFGDADKLAGLQQASGNKQQADAAGLQNSIARLEDLLASMAQYVQGVVEGKTKGDPVLGRYLADTMAVVPQIDRQDFERLFNENVQDVLLVSYLSNLVRVQLALSDKLGTPALPVL